MATKAVVQIEVADGVAPAVLRDTSEVSLTRFRQFINVPGIVGAIVPDAPTEIIIESHQYYDLIWDGTITDQWFKLVFKAAATGFTFTFNAELLNNQIRHVNPNEYLIIGNETIWLSDPVTSSPNSNNSFMFPYGNVFYGSFAIDTGVISTDIARKFHFHARVDGSDNLIKMYSWFEFQDRRFVKTF